ncbi:sodium:alanine symporter family protein [Eggerthellaceae bacterium zg-1084]|uniref:alanine/glycine:cation symporter family protein n=1 Tax=Berryella wangjianweii TaxID=2734634 RepID=UPI001554A07B|nr:amino acid carrier protein [Berryella wangjianweii]NPD31026.1 sodium:alanine symporter family protein [Berryella wangjianweii]
MEATLLGLVGTINSYLSNYVLVFLLVGAGLFFTIRTRGIQFRRFGEGMRRMFGNFSLRGDKSKSGMTSFQALATAVAAQVGTGNIVGACGALLVGGPGAIFWMWLIAILGMATNYAEAVLAQKTRKIDPDGTVHGGPVYYITAAFTGAFGKFLAGFFAVAIILALGFMGCMVQSNSIAETVNNAFGIPTWVVGLVVVVLAGFVFLGGVSRLASVTEKLVPIMAVIYIVAGICVLVVNWQNVGPALALIFQSAFNPAAEVGGATFGIIAALSQGAKRGLFSNEAGMGSTPHAHAMANVSNPHEQGTMAMIGVFIDTIVVVSITALVIVSTLFVGDGALAQDFNGALAGGLSKTNLAQTAFGTMMGADGGNIFVAVCLFMFAFSTILGWNLFAKINVQYLFPRHKKAAVTVFSVLALGFIFLGSLASNDLVWELADLFNQLMVLPNVIALVAMSGAVVATANQFGGSERAKDADGDAEGRTE